MNASLTAVVVLQEHHSDGVEVGQPAELTETEFNADVEALFGV